MSVIITAKVNGSNIDCDNRVAGAQSSFNDVIIRATLEGDWESTPSCVASFTDAHGELASTVLLLPNMRPDPDVANVYDIPIPVDAKKYEGDISFVLTGFNQAGGTGDVATFSGTGSQTVFTFSGDKPFFIVSVTVGGTALPATEWSYGYDNGTLTFAEAPAAGTNNITVVYKDNVTAAILRTANCILRVLPADFSVVTDDELDSSIVEQLLAELYYQQGYTDEAKTARDEAIAAKEDAETAEAAAVSAKDDAVAAKNHAQTSSTAAFNYKEQALTAQGKAEIAQAAAEEAARTAASSNKADKVLGARNGDFAGLNGEGNLVDSGYNADDFITTEDLDDFMTAVPGATQGDFAVFDAEGKVADSGKKAADFAAASHTHTASQITDFTDAISGKMDKGEDDSDYDVAVFDGTGQVRSSYVSIIDLENAADECARFITLSLMSTQAYVDSNYPASAHNGEWIFTTDNHKLYVAVQNVWRDMTSKYLNSRNLYLYSAKFYYYNGTTLVGAGYQTAGSYAPSVHTHTLSQVNGLPVPTAGDAGKVLMVNAQGEYYLSSASPTPVTTFTITLHGTGAESLCKCWLESDPSTVYYSEDQGYMGQVEIASNDALVCYVSNTIRAVTLNGETQTLDSNNECRIVPTGDMALTFTYTGPGDQSVIQIVM